MSKIIVSKDGPYLVTGGIPLAIQTILPNDEGDSWSWQKGRTLDTKPAYKLCRCGHSKTKPFCDDTHKQIHFDGTETATREKYSKQAKVFDGPQLTLSDAEALCSSARFCHPHGMIWSLVKNTDDPEVRELTIHEGTHCPSGRLVLTRKETGDEIESEFEPSIGVVDDPGAVCSGPLWVRGRVLVESEGGTPYEIRNRVTLCRCGASQNKPFCDGSHIEVKFEDGLT